MLSIKNVCLVYDMAALYGLSKLMQSCCYFMDRHAGDVIQHESFSNLSRDSVRAIISRYVNLRRCTVWSVNEVLGGEDDNHLRG